MWNWIDKTDLDSVALETRAMHRYGADESSAPTCIDRLSWVCVDDALAPQDMFHVKQRRTVGCRAVDAGSVGRQSAAGAGGGVVSNCSHGMLEQRSVDEGEVDTVRSGRSCFRRERPSFVALRSRSHSVVSRRLSPIVGVRHRLPPVKSSTSVHDRGSRYQLATSRRWEQWARILRYIPHRTAGHSRVLVLVLDGGGVNRSRSSGMWSILAREYMHSAPRGPVRSSRYEVKGLPLPGAP